MTTTLQTLFEQGDLSLEQVLVAAAEGVRPPERLTVSEAAERYRKINQPGSYVGDWKNATTPYLVEPMDVLTSTAHTAMVFVGPAQTGKTDMFMNWLTYSVICDPADMMLIEKSQTSARDFSIRRIDRLHRHSKDVGQRLISRRNSDNTFDKRYASGMLLNMSWPSINELSGRPVPRLWLSDHDRMADDVDGEGAPFDLARKRSTTFRSHAMCVAESSPGYVVEDTNWIATSPHQAPPTQGILALYNRGDRRRWYWRCVVCKNAFEPDFGLLHWPDSEDMLEAAEMATLKCPHCQIDYHHDPMDGMPGKHELNNNGRWVRDGMVWRPDGEIAGKPFRSDIASFWLKGVAAAFTNWKGLVFKYLQAEDEYEKTGSEQALKTTVNTDHGNPYIPKSQATARVPEALKRRASDLGHRVVPHGVRFLVATIDVQKNRFVVQVHGVGVGGDLWVVDRFDIKHSIREDPERPGQYLWVNAGAYGEDWKLLVSQVLKKSYPLIDGSGREMAIKMTLCDSGGREGVTTNAYNFVRWLMYGPRQDEPQIKEADGYPEWEPGLSARFLLLRGTATPTAPRIQIRFPDSQRADRHAGARGEIPVLFVQTNSVKDTLDKMLDREDPRGGRINFPEWLPDWFFTELTVEIKDPKKGWVNPKNFRNESWDLLAYCVAATLTHHIGIEHIDWNDPPSWASNWDSNDLVFNPVAESKPFANQGKDEAIDFSKLGEQLA